MDYKDLTQQNIVDGSIPIQYYPFSIVYDGTWIGERSTTELNAGVVMSFRGAGSSDLEIEKNRFEADSSFFYFRGDLTHEYEFKSGWQIFGRVHGQVSDGPLVNSEQYAGGGAETARGYLEAEALGDNGIFGTLEFRTPSILRTKRVPKVEGSPDESTGNEWRFYAFGDIGTVVLYDTLPEQDSSFKFASIGLGTEIQLREHFHGLVEIALPFTTLTETVAHDPRVNFRLWADF